jgi:hypothetical protein
MAAIHRTPARWWLAATSAGLLTASLLGPAAAYGTDGCPSGHRVTVPGAEYQEVACLADLTTAGTVATGHTDPGDWAGLHAAGTRNPTGVPGVQIDGYFPDSSTLNASHGWRHDSQFVLRLPDRWNGGLVITGAPGVREQYANDFIIGDWVLARGYAFAATDKGNVGVQFHTDGERPGDAVAEWHARVTQLTLAARAVVAQRYGHAPTRTYVTGISNGGYLARWQLENRGWLYDGGVDWEGTLFTAEGPNLFTFLPPALRHYPRAATGDEAAHRAILDAGFEPGSERLWPFHYSYYWDLTQRIYREEFDPDYDGDALAGYPFCAPGSVPGCDADYDYASRPAEVHDAVARVSLTGDITKPMITLHGTLDTLLPIRVDSDVYAGLVGDASHFRYYRIEGGNHVDGLYPAYADLVRPILPCYRAAFTALEDWVERRIPAPPSTTVPKPDGADQLNTCRL